MNDGVVFAPLTNKLVARQPVAKNADVLFILNRDFRETLTLRSLVLLCEACCMRPTAAMLAFALQNSIPGLVGLPMDNPDPGYYLDIAQKFFDPTEIPFVRRMDICRRVHNDEQRNEFFPIDTELDDNMSSYYPIAMDCYVEAQMDGMRHVMTTKKGRDFLKEIITGWKAHYEQAAPDDPRYPRFTNHLLNILEHGMVLRYRNVRPGWLGYGAWRVPFNDDEHL